MGNYFSYGPGVDVDEYHYSPTIDKVRDTSKTYYIVSGYTVGRTVKACEHDDFNDDGSFRSMHDTYWYLKYGLIFTSEMDILSGGDGKHVTEVDADDYGLMYMEQDGSRQESLTIDELYPWTKDRKRNRAKTYYYQSSESSCSKMKVYSDTSKSWFDADKEFRLKDDPFWKEKGFDFSGEDAQFLPYREKNEDLAGSESQGGCGGGGGGCGKKGGACCAKAKNNCKKKCCKSKLGCCKGKAKAAFGCSANVNSLLKGLINVATCCTGLCDLLSSLIEPEKLGMMFQMINSTSEMLSQAALLAQDTVANVTNVLGVDSNQALALATQAVASAMGMEGVPAAAAAAINAAMNSASNNVSNNVSSACSGMKSCASKCCGGCCGKNKVLNTQMDTLKNTSTNLASLVAQLKTGTNSELGQVSNLISSTLGTTPAAVQALSAVASANTSISNLATSSLNTMQNAYNVASILGVN